MATNRQNKNVTVTHCQIQTTWFCQKNGPTQNRVTKTVRSNQNTGGEQVLNFNMV